MSKYLDLQIAADLDGADPSSVVVVDTGDEDPRQKCSFVTFYTSAAATLVECFLAKHAAPAHGPNTQADP